MFFGKKIITTAKTHILSYLLIYCFFFFPGREETPKQEREIRRDHMDCANMTAFFFPQCMYSSTENKQRNKKMTLRITPI